jgi:hypothetical protein
VKFIALHAHGSNVTIFINTAFISQISSIDGHAVIHRDGTGVEVMETIAEVYQALKDAE